MSSAITSGPGVPGWAGALPSQVTYVLDRTQQLQYKVQTATASVEQSHAPGAPTCLDLAVTGGSTTLYLTNVPQDPNGAPGTWHVPGITYGGSPF